jgi:hypothetical protein
MLILFYYILYIQYRMHKVIIVIVIAVAYILFRSNHDNFENILEGQTDNVDKKEQGGLYKGHLNKERNWDDYKEQTADLKKSIANRAGMIKFLMKNAKATGPLRTGKSFISFIEQMRVYNMNHTPKLDQDDLKYINSNVCKTTKPAPNHCYNWDDLITEYKRVRNEQDKRTVRKQDNKLRKQSDIAKSSAQKDYESDKKSIINKLKKKSLNQKLSNAEKSQLKDMEDSIKTDKKEFPNFRQLLCLLQEYLLRYLTIEGKKYWYSRHDYGMYILSLN